MRNLRVVKRITPILCKCHCLLAVALARLRARRLVAKVVAGKDLLSNVKGVVLNLNARVASRTSQCEAIQVEREMSRKMKKKANPRITQKNQEARGEIARLPLRLERVVVARKP